MIKAVIFDLDGLMVDSEPVHFKAYEHVLRELGKIVPESDYAERYVGISDGDAAQDIVKRYHLSIRAEELLARKSAAFAKLLPGHVVPKEGLFDLLKNLRIHGYKTAVASGAMLSDIEKIIAALRLQNSFDALCSAEHVAHGKPAPDVFLLAAQKLGVQPAESLVLEDAPVGAQAAHAAGMKCYAIPSRETKGRSFTGATQVLSSLSEVFAALQQEK